MFFSNNSVRGLYTAGIFGAIVMSIGSVVAGCWLVYNKTGSRTNVLKIQASRADLLVAKAEYYRARANSIEYLKKCTPESDALHDIAESLSQDNQEGSGNSSNNSSMKVSPKFDLKMNK